MQAHPPDPWRPLLDLLSRLPEDVRQPLVDLLDGVVETLRSPAITGSVSVEAQAQTAEAYGTVSPASVRLEPGQVTVTVAPGELTVARGTPPGPLAWRPQLLIFGLVVSVILSFYDRPFAEGLAEALRELSLILIGLSAPPVLREWWRQR